MFPSGVGPRRYSEVMSEENKNDIGETDELHEQRIIRLEVRLQQLEKALQDVGRQMKSLENGAAGIKWDEQKGTLGAQLKSISEWRADL